MVVSMQIDEFSSYFVDFQGWRSPWERRLCKQMNMTKGQVLILGKC